MVIETLEQLKQSIKPPMPKRYNVHQVVCQHKGKNRHERRHEAKMYGFKEVEASQNEPYRKFHYHILELPHLTEYEAIKVEDYPGYFKQYGKYIQPTTRREYNRRAA